MRKNDVAVVTKTLPPSYRDVLKVGMLVRVENAKSGQVPTYGMHYPNTHNSVLVEFGLDWYAFINSADLFPVGRF